MAPRAVGFIGLGIMGSRMAACLRRAGYELTVWNRTPERAQAWVDEHGGRVAGSPREAAEGADAVITMVVDGAQVESLLLGDDGAVAGAAPGTLFVDMSTIGPVDARRIGAALQERGHRFVDAPVTGSSPAAESGTLTIMAGGAKEDVEAAMPLFEAMGEVIVRAGDLGQGQAVKVLSNAVSAVNCATLAQAFVVGRREGLDLDALVEVMRGGSAASKMLDLKARPMLEHDYTPLFKLEHMLKDVQL
jgi:3-hydroxyisobutyrate dehydrogenase-like beta-hydroxyacid dehydrogenase